MATRIASLFAEIGANTAPFEQGAKKVKGGLEGLKGGFSSLGLSSVASFLSIGGAIAGTVAVLKNVTDTTTKYANEVRTLSSLSGESTESTSRFLQVLDDYKISAEEAMVATRALTKEGHTPSIETLAQLSDQYLALNSAEDRNAFVLKNLGRGGLQWVEVLQQGSTALKVQGAAVNANLILSQKAVDAARANEIAVDNWNDSIQGLRISLGNDLLPVMTGAVNSITAAQRAQEILGDEFNHSVLGTQKWKDALAQAKEEQQAATQAMLKHADAMDENAKSTEDAKAAQDAFNTSMDQLNSLIGGELGPAQDDYNAKIAEYKEQLTQARTAEEKMGILDKINEETEAYNKRANAIIFNIQQQAIMAQVESGVIKPEDVDEATQAITDLAYSYGLVDEKTKAAADSTNAAIAQFAATGNLEVFRQQLYNISQNTQESADVMDATAKSRQNFSDNVYHLGKRAIDTAEQLGEFKDSQAALASGINKEAGPAVYGLKSALQSMPPSGSSWSYAFTIHTTGQVPRINPGAAQNPITVPVASHWMGGQIGNGWGVVGDAMGGAWTPYTELVTPTGFVLDAKTSKKLKEAGMIGDAINSFYFGSGTGDWSMEGTRISGTSAPRPRRVSGGRAGSTSSSSSMSSSPSAESATNAISGQVAADVGSTVAGVIAGTQGAIANTNVQSNAVLNEINNNIKDLVAKVSTDRGIGREVAIQNSKLS